MNSIPFIGRKQQLQALQGLLHKKIASLVVTKGRRRIGKSRLLEKFAEGKKFYRFSGLPPTEQTTAQSQRDEFAAQLSYQTGLPEIKVDDWSKLFLLLADKIRHEPIIVLFDEISWMGDKDPNFLGKLKNAWDLHFKNNPQLIFILCGSVSSWIEKNIISSTGFLGRISLKITLEELPLKDCNALLEAVGFKRSAQEKLLLLAVTGGVPWYIEQIAPSYSANENIKNLCFTKDGLLVDEFQHIFHTLFDKRKIICQKIVNSLAKGPKEYSEIAATLNYTSSGAMSEYLDDLLVSNFIKRDYTWLIKSGRLSSLSHFRLSDNYLRFYLKYIAPKHDQINKGQYAMSALTALPGWYSIMGLQFENLVLQNRYQIFQALNLKPEEVLIDNPFFQRKTTTQQGCQIDYLIQTRYNTLFACEIKFSKNIIGVSIVANMQEKLSRLTLPKGFACMPVLIHINEVSDEVHECDYFIKLINFAELLTNTGE